MRSLENTEKLQTPTGYPTIVLIITASTVHLTITFASNHDALPLILTLVLPHTAARESGITTGHLVTEVAAVVRAITHPFGRDAHARAALKLMRGACCVEL